MLEAKLEELRATAVAAIAAAESPEELERVRVDVLGRKGAIAQVSKEMGKVAPEQRGPIGKLLNAAKQEIEAAFEFESPQVPRGGLRVPPGRQLNGPQPARSGVRPGSLHPITQIQAEIED